MKFPTESLLFFGSGETLARLVEMYHSQKQEVFVVTSQRHFDEKMPGSDRSLGFFLETMKIPFHVTQDINHDPIVQDKITPQTTAISFGAAWVFRSNFIEKFNGRLLNCHGSRLPQDRGGGFLSWNILRGDRNNCCLLHQITPGIDEGPVVAWKEIVYPASCRVPQDFFSHYSEENFHFVKNFLNEAKEGKDFKLCEQPPYLGTYWPRLSTLHHGFIDWNWDNKEIESFICAFDEPYPGASTFLNGNRVHLKNVVTVSSDGSFHPFQAGIVYRLSNNGVYIAAKKGGLLVGSLTDVSSNDLKAKIKLGDRLHTPQEYLDNAHEYRAVFMPTGLKEI